MYALICTIIVSLGAVPYVNTSGGRATVRPFPKNSMEPAVNDVTDDAGSYELVGTADAVYSEAYGDVMYVAFSLIIKVYIKMMV